MSVSPSNLSNLLSHLSLPPSTSRLAIAIHSTVSNTQEESSSYLAACAIYLALLTDNSHSPISLFKLLTHPPKQLRITHFFQQDKQKLKSLLSNLSNSPSPIHESHKSFMVIAIIWRDFTRLAYHANILNLSSSIQIPSSQKQVFDTSNFVFHKIHQPNSSSSSQLQSNKQQQLPSHQHQQDLFINTISTAAATCPTTRTAWLLFLVSKAHVSGASPLTKDTAYHLLLASLCAAGFVTTDKDDDSMPEAINSICKATRSSVQQVRRLFNAIQTSLPPPLRSKLPCIPPPKEDPNLSSFTRLLDAEYSHLLITPTLRNIVDERVFIDAPHQAAARRDERATAAANVIPTISSSSSSAPSPNSATKQKSDLKLPPQTPRTRAHKLSQRMPITPLNINRRLPRSDALDALAAVAVAATNGNHESLTKTPKSNRSLKPRNTAIPLTPISSRFDSLKWLSTLADSRPETSQGSNHRPNQASKEVVGNTSITIPIRPSEHLKKIISANRTWNRLIHEILGLSRALVASKAPIASEYSMRHALAVYFEALEGILRQEWEHMSQEKERVIENLIDNAIFHRCLLVFSWETVAGANGRPAGEVAIKAMSLFEVSPFAVSKIVEAFLTYLPNMPKQLKSHILNCDRRFVEYLAWDRDSELVSTIRAWREWSARSNRLSNKEKEEQTRKENSNNTKERIKPVQNDDSKSENRKDLETLGKGTPIVSLQHGDISTTSGTKSIIDEKTSINATSPETKFGTGKEFALELFYRKLLRIASERTQKLLLSLSLDGIVEPVWAAIKYSICEKWTLMVGRHLDHIIMCCVYGVCRVRKLQIKFLEVLQHFRQLGHVTDPSYLYITPDISRNVSLKSHRDLTLTDGTQIPSTRIGSSQDVGDIIKFYNHIFIAAMKTFLLGNIDGSGSVGLTTPRTVPTNANSNGIPRTPISRCSPVIGETENITPHGNRRDALTSAVLNSPMRVMRQLASPRRIGRVTVSPMTDNGRHVVLGTTHTNTPRGMMTPATRRLFAFAESPVGSLKWINRTVEGENGNLTGFRTPVPLSFDGQNAEQTTASIKRRYADVLGGKNITTDKRCRLDNELEQRSIKTDVHETSDQDIKLGASLGSQQHTKEINGFVPNAKELANTSAKKEPEETKQ